MKVTTIILIVSCILLMGLSIFLTNQYEKSQSDLCYSLKVNRIMVDGWKEKFGETEGMDKFYSSLKIMEERNWMGCDEDSNLNFGSLK